MKFLTTLALCALVATAHAADPEYPKQGPDLYDTQADGTAQIAAALTQAKAEHKHVLLKLGANWCIWCRRLSEAFHRHDAVAQKLAADYVVVLIDMNQRDGRKRNLAVNERYGNPIQNGYPVLLVLDADGNLLTTQETGALEDGGKGHDPEKILAFLRRWAPAR
ncbi:thiol:disulfide interchange protein precursor [Lacunisphaera limnophila]|uniref:Thiol:disulfide interchange protein n=1 Tax=Lacunisphaera limnophila TaxID=1838286 RepID=A0A1I7PHD8_9BACT|nr:thioredoxin family protein [Lacunisphaera limnophila]AOS43016.1 thiol:disulfide interchange protein precursor [Lacunisphaera limnophila]